MSPTRTATATRISGVFTDPLDADRLIVTGEVDGVRQPAYLTEYPIDFGGRADYNAQPAIVRDLETGAPRFKPEKDWPAKPITARVWRSALTNHVDHSGHGDSGHNADPASDAGINPQTGSCACPSRKLSPEEAGDVLRAALEEAAQPYLPAQPATPALLEELLK